MCIFVLKNSFSDDYSLAMLATGGIHTVQTFPPAKLQPILVKVGNCQSEMSCRLFTKSVQLSVGNVGGGQIVFLMQQKMCCWPYFNKRNCPPYWWVDCLINIWQTTHFSVHQKHNLPAKPSCLWRANSSLNVWCEHLFAHTLIKQSAQHHGGQIV